MSSEQIISLIEIIQVENPRQIDEVKGIFREYETWLGMSLCFQRFEEELKGLPGKYEPPDGRLYLPYRDNELAGCIALRRFNENICEMKRLFLRENARGHGIGNMLIERVIKDALVIGYKKIRLDTYPPKMGKTVSLYESHGFYSIHPYYENPHEGVLFMEKIL